MADNTINKQYRTLLYLASGPYREAYEDLPYDKVVLVDRALSYANYKVPSNSKAEFWNMDALPAIDEIARRKLIINGLVSVNEGIDEGGGDYRIFSEFLMGYIGPFLADDVLVITDLAYEGISRVKNHVAKMDWGFEKIKKLQPSDAEYINPSVFSSEKKLKGKVDADYGDVFLLKRAYSKVSKTIGRIQMQLIHGSIWKDKAHLDAIGLSMPQIRKEDDRSITQSVLNFFYRKPATFPLNKLSILEILELCKKDQKFKIGLMPWLEGEYKMVFNDLYKYRGPESFELSFYHLNKEDYQELYLYFGEYFVMKFPNFFQDIKRDENLWALFEEALNKGKGFSIFKLCEELSSYVKLKSIAFHFNLIKLKSGKLKVYTNSNDSYIKGLIKMLVALDV
jgi:hypothetical protein